MVNADDFLNYARTIFTSNAKEIQLRASISRAYYSAFHNCNAAANDFCGTIPIAESKKKGTHEILFYRISNCCEDASIKADLKVMAEEAKKLKILRTIADYDISRVVTSGDATKGLSHSSAVEKTYKSVRKRKLM